MECEGSINSEIVTFDDFTVLNSIEIYLKLKGDFSLVTDKKETIGYALRSKNNVNPIFISPGNGMSLNDSMAITLRCIGKYRLPEPTRNAHEFVNKFRTGELKEGYHEIAQTRLF